MYSAQVRPLVEFENFIAAQEALADEMRQETVNFEKWANFWPASLQDLLFVHEEVRWLLLIDVLA